MKRVIFLIILSSILFANEDSIKEYKREFSKLSKEKQEKLKKEYSFLLEKQEKLEKLSAENLKRIEELQKNIKIYKNYLNNTDCIIQKKKIEKIETLISNLTKKGKKEIEIKKALEDMRVAKEQKYQKKCNSEKIDKIVADFEDVIKKINQEREKKK